MRGLRAVARQVSGPLERHDLERARAGEDRDLRQDRLEVEDSRRAGRSRSSRRARSRAANARAARQARARVALRRRGELDAAGQLAHALDAGVAKLLEGLARRPGRKPIQSRALVAVQCARNSHVSGRRQCGDGSTSGRARRRQRLALRAQPRREIVRQIGDLARHVACVAAARAGRAACAPRTKSPSSSTSSTDATVEARAARADVEVEREVVERGLARAQRRAHDAQTRAAARSTRSTKSDARERAVGRERGVADRRRRVGSAKSARVRATARSASAPTPARAGKQRGRERASSRRAARARRALGLARDDRGLGELGRVHREPEPARALQARAMAAESIAATSLIARRDRAQAIAFDSRAARGSPSAPKPQAREHLVAVLARRARAGARHLGRGAAEARRGRGLGHARDLDERLARARCAGARAPRSWRAPARSTRRCPP